MGEEILLTGGTGYIGSALAARWLEGTDASLHLLVRGKRGESPRERAARALAPLLPADDAPAWTARVAVHDGDVAHGGLGLPPAAREALAARVTRIVHCAAAARFDLDLDEARRVNLGGTREILDFAASCPRLERLLHVSTAFVAGNRRGLVHEEDLEAGAGHRNTYERSKFEAEALVRSRMDALPVTVLRPSIVICDARTGRISAYNGFARAMIMLARGALEAIPGDPDAPLDLVPLDTVVEAAHLVMGNPAAEGRTFHCTAGPDRATPLAAVCALVRERTGGPPLPIVSTERFLSALEAMAPALDEERRKQADEIRLYLPYLSALPLFDNAGMRDLTGLTVPRLADYFPRLWTHVAALAPA